jgi:VWFA-related protein
MTRRFAVLLSCALIAFGQRGTPPPGAAPDPWVVDAVALDASGHPVADLTADDFEIVQGGKARKITHFTWFDTRLHMAATPATLLPALDVVPDEIRRNVVVVVDDLGLSVAGIVAVREKLKAFVGNSMASGDQAAILRTSGGSGVRQQLTDDKRMLLETIEAIQYLGAGTSATSAGNASWLTLRYALEGLSYFVGRKVVVIFSENPGATGPRELALAEAANAAHAGAAAVYALDPLTAAPAAPTSPPTILAALVRDTGGAWGGDFARVLEAEQGYYAIGFLPPEDENAVDLSGRWSPSGPVSIKVRRPGVEVRSRTGYVGYRARVEFPAPAAHTALLNAALSSPFAGRDIRADLTAVLTDYPREGPMVETILNFYPRDFSCIHNLQDKYQCSVQLRLAAYSEDGRSTTPLERGYQLTLRPEEYRAGREYGLRASFQVKLPPGPGGWQIRAVVADVASDRMGSATRFVETPNVPRGVLALSGLILHSDSAAPESLTADPRGTAGVRIFKPGESCTYAYDVFNPLIGPDKKSTLEVQTRLFAGGRTILNGKPERVTFGETAKGAHSQFSGHLKLDPLMAPGDYVLQVMVRDTLAPAGEVRQMSQFIEFQVGK